MQPSVQSYQAFDTAETGHTRGEYPRKFGRKMGAGKFPRICGRPESEGQNKPTNPDFPADSGRPQIQSLLREGFGSYSFVPIPLSWDWSWFLFLASRRFRETADGLSFGRRAESLRSRSTEGLWLGRQRHRVSKSPLHIGKPVLVRGAKPEVLRRDGRRGACSFDRLILLAGPSPC